MPTATSIIVSRMVLATAILLAGAAGLLVPKGVLGARLLAAQDDPARLSDLTLERTFDAPVANREIAAALAADDADLAQSMVALADERDVRIEPQLRQRTEAAGTASASAQHAVGQFAEGFVTGEPQNLASLAGTVTGDLFVFGDIRDVVRESAHAARGEKVDDLILGLACVGLAVTAGTYATLGAGAPARVGVSVVKAAGKAGRISARMMQAVTRPLRGLVDRAALAAALTPATLLRPALAIRAARDAVKIEKLHGLVSLADDVGRVQAKAGTRAALDGLRLAESPQDVARLARLAAAKGGKTRAIVKILGRGAIMLGFGAFQVASWIFWALLNVLGLCAALKRLVEHATLRVIAARKGVAGAPRLDLLPARA